VTQDEVKMKGANSATKSASAVVYHDRAASECDVTAVLLLSGSIKVLVSLGPKQFPGTPPPWSLEAQSQVEVNLRCWLVGSNRRNVVVLLSYRHPIDMSTSLCS